MARSGCAARKRGLAVMIHTSSPSAWNARTSLESSRKYSGPLRPTILRLREVAILGRGGDFRQILGHLQRLAMQLLGALDGLLQALIDRRKQIVDGAGFESL
jgi:hypothetical protein